MSAAIESSSSDIGRYMDKITKGLLAEFSAEFEIPDLPEDTQFENFATYLAVRRHFSEETFMPSDLVLGSGSDTGIDGVGIVVNNNLVTDIDTIDDLATVNGFIDATFVFVQADRGASFSTQKIGQFAFGVKDIFGAKKLTQSEDIKRIANLIDKVYSAPSKFKGRNPACILYYVTTGKLVEQNDIRVRCDAEVSDLKATGLFRNVEFVLVGADQIQSLYNQTKNAIQREFIFSERVVVPDVAGVKEAYLGYIGAKEIIQLICDDQGEIIKSLFYENVRDWEGYNQINTEIRGTLQSATKDRFVLMNNGVTIIAKSLQPTSNRFVIGDFQIVNGCQTLHVLHDNEELLDDAVRIPVRIISTTDEAVVESVITATNRQTAVSSHQFFALKTFAKKLEVYFRTFDVEKRLYYERRTHQYDSQDIDVPKKRIVTHQNLVRAVGAMFLGEPHRTTRNFARLDEKVGQDFFIDGDRPELYYVSAYTAFCLEQLFNDKFAGKKSGRYHILLAARLRMDQVELPPFGANAMGKRCDDMMQKLWKDADGILVDAVAAVDKVAGANWDPDHIRTQAITDGLFTHFGFKKGKKS